MAALLAIVGERNRAIRRERVFRDRQNPLEQPDDCIVKKYRLPRQEILRLSDELRGDLERETRRNNAVPVELQVCAALRCLASGSFQNVLGDTLSLSQPTLSRIISAFTEALVRRVNRYVRLPDEDGRLAKMQQFARVGGFPRVLGVIDGTHIRIKAPKQDEHLYVNRKNFHSINVQLVCDANYMIMDVVAKWPGSSHDSFILENSSLYTLFQEGLIPEGWLLGNSIFKFRTNFHIYKFKKKKH